MTIILQACGACEKVPRRFGKSLCGEAVRGLQRWGRALGDFAPAMYSSLVCLPGTIVVALSARSSVPNRTNEIAALRFGCIAGSTLLLALWVAPAVPFSKAVGCAIADECLPEPDPLLLLDILRRLSLVSWQLSILLL